MKRAVAWMVLVLLGLSPVTGFAVSFDAKDFDQLVAESEQIFIGTTSGAMSRRHPGGAIVTDVSFAGVQVIKGNAGNAEISLMIAGGSLGTETLALPGMPRFQFGLTYLVFVQGNGTTIFPVVGGDQGMFQVKSDTLTGESLVFDSRGMPIRSATVRQAMAADGAAPSSTEPEPITLDVFLRGIRSRLGSQ
ncbi:MAG: hypothetical protein A3H91_13900 [Gammaproteobacteria bacterium RIFCSPLOWO2_02_FULL_61_13]|nr:MAG: hypothetical protein A3H91_13900 [Gammaproteobacteria bacterium RIFCSPLOWO2_02_FULL_61_13]